MVAKTCLLALLLTPVLILACGGSASKGPASPTPSASPTARVTPTAPAGPTPLASPTAPVSHAPRMITSADDNQTVLVGLGEYLVLALDSGFDWSGVEVSDPSVLQAVLGATPPAGAQGLYYAARVGEATLSATGRVHCPPNVPCPQLARLFRVTIRVRG